ncbi:MAG: hypothetical protein ACPG4N_05200 [Gammaproteobacteria bacterium]
MHTVASMKTTPYFRNTVQVKRPYVTEALCRQVIDQAVRREEQPDGRIRYWGRAGERWLRVVLLADDETLHNAFFDRRFTP